MTLASNERVPLTPSMRLMFEIGHVKAATPATVSRAGILFVNPNDLGWNPCVHMNTHKYNHCILCASLPVRTYVHKPQRVSFAVDM